MTLAKRELMEQHKRYWMELTDQGTAVVFGPVLDPTGLRGLAIVEVANEEEARTVSSADPAVSGGLQSPTVSPMRVGKIRGEHD